MLFFDFMNPYRIYMIYNALFFIAVFVVFKYRKSLSRFEEILRFVVLALLLYTHAIRYVHPFLTGTFSYQEHLPFHICRISGFILIYALITKDPRMKPLLFYMVGTGIYGIFVPNGGIRNIAALTEYFFIDHLVFAMVPFYLVAVKGYRPSYKETWRIPLFTLMVMLMFIPVNAALNSEYFHARDIVIAQTLIPDITMPMFIVLFNLAMTLNFNLYFIGARRLNEKKVTEKRAMIA